jgi:hypothetical protein
MQDKGLGSQKAYAFETVSSVWGVGPQGRRARKQGDVEIREPTCHVRRGTITSSHSHSMATAQRLLRETASRVTSNNAYLRTILRRIPIDGRLHAPAQASTQTSR